MTQQVVSAYGTTAQRVLAIPEILELVFSFLSTKNTANCACVCKRWSEIALDTLWRDVDDIRRLFGLLAPIEHGATPDDPHHFPRPLEPTDWARFMRYAPRVRTLSVTAINDSRLRGQLVFDEVARTRSTLNLLPRLSKLSWTSQLGDRLRLSLVFMHENIRHFAVRLVPSDNYPFSVYFEEIALRMPKLTCLDMRFSFAVRDIEAELCKLLDGLPHLQKVILPKFTLTSKIIEQLSTNSSLKVVQFEFMEEQGSGEASDVHNWFPNLRPGAFPSLVDLSVSVHLPHMVRFLKSGSCPAHLQCLYVHVLYIVPPYQVREFVDAVSEHCQQLTQLHIDFVGDPSPLMFRTRLSDDDRIGLNTLRPLLNLTKLAQFILNWDAPLALTQDDIEELASSMPSLEVLTLCPEPMPCPQAPPLTLKALIPFARHCPNMRELSLYLDASTADLDDASRQLYTALPPIHFRKLQRVNFGLSRIPEYEPVALFLSQLCPPGCKVDAGVTWPEGFTAMEAQSPEDASVLVDMWGQASDWYPRWQEVNQMLPLLIKVRIEERMRRRELQREVEDLRMRCRVWEERLNVGVPQDGGCTMM
ncbi:hypothetical protein PYCCODRAFT_1419774 [Trametes coccinea BRFM310]|uniref:F-box domain-containing protein n=1 Tax=Trametes coccinea (strain BRFM310) TaxID=1353009 RepID=A0A1Y2I7Z0_TRAC3|nr:hypothetical protein PYCCODRAFT_1419774 [Trametes coccinea BRFM310]